MPRTLIVCAAAFAAIACGDRGTRGGTSAQAALSAECTDPELIVESQTLSLWPPNHKFHEVTVADCISAVGTCDGELEGEFIWASSDEPIDDLGDGHHAPDIGLGIDTGHVCVRSERQGPEDGRVYKLGVRVVDAAGTEVERECVVIVDHDQRGVVAVDSSESYRVEFDASEAGLDCEGNPVEPPGGGTGGGGDSGSGGAGGAGNGGGGEICTDADGCEGGEGTSGEGGSGEAGEGGEGGEGGSGGEVCIEPNPCSDEGEGGAGGDGEGEGDAGEGGTGEDDGDGEPGNGGEPVGGNGGGPV